MFKRKPRRFRRRPNGRSFLSRVKDKDGKMLGSNSFSNGHPMNNFRTPQSAERLFEKYNAMAKEALSSGDKTASENFFQHADHFMRIIGDKNRNQNQSKPQAIDKPIADEKQLTDNSVVNQDKDSKK